MSLLMGKQWLKLDQGDPEALTANDISYNSQQSVFDAINQGITGIGLQGATGVSGETGAQGTTGAGIQGITGAGVAGVQGATGLQGLGIQGVTGVSGLGGHTGIQGETGIGFQGATGALGLSGATGVQGIPGTAASQGATGVAGIQGETGETGAGIQGSTGVQGTRGYQGAQGIQGVTGVEGTQGTTGVLPGTGAPGRLALWAPTDTLSSSPNLFWDTTNSNLGIGTTQPASAFVNPPTGHIELTGGMTFSDGAGVESTIYVPPPVASTSLNRGNIQNAIDAVAGAGGGKVILANGTYEVDQIFGGSDATDLYSYAIMMKRGVYLTGSGYNSTIITTNLSGDATRQYDLIRVERYTSGGQIRIKMQDFMVDGNRQDYVTGIRVGKGEGRYSEDVQPAYLENIQTLRCNKGIHVESWFTEIHNCKVTDNVIGVDLNFQNTGLNRTSPAEPEFSNCIGIYHTQFWGNTDSAIHILKGFANNIVGCNMGIPANAYGIRMDAGYEGKHRAIYIAGNYIERSGDFTNVTGIQVASQGTSIIGNYFDMDLTDGCIPVSFINSDVENGTVMLGNVKNYTIQKMCLNGNVGIGTTDPKTALDIYEESSGYNGLFLRTASVNNAPFLTWATDGTSTSPDDKYSMRYNGTQKKFYIGYGDANGFDDQITIHQATGNVGVGTTHPTSRMHVVGLPQYANNAAAVGGGLAVGAFYRTGGDPDQVCVVH